MSYALFQDVSQQRLKRSVMTNVKRALQWVPAIQERWMSQQVEGLVRSGQPWNLMNTALLIWENTTIAGILMRLLMESGATPLIQTKDGTTVLFQDVMHITNVKRNQLILKISLDWGLAMLEI